MMKRKYREGWRLKISFAGALLACICTISTKTFSQDTTGTIVLPAGPDYQKSKNYQSLWGKHYRKEWTTPVRVKIAMLDTLAGGLTPYQIGGSRQTKSVRLRDKNNREYVLRSINKTFSGALPPITKGTFIEAMANDQASIAHPYSALTIAPLAEAAKIYHTNPAVYYIPKQKALGEFNEEIGDQLYLFEQRPDEDWSTAPNFGNSKKIRSTEKLREKLLEKNKNDVDQVAFARARLFDMFIGDWGRHDDQWRWAEFESDDQNLYRPVPRDRDQAYTIFDGIILKSAISLAASHIESFDHNINDINKFNYPARNIDRLMLNEVSRQQWIDNAKDLQRLLTDEVIDNAIREFPPEVYSFSGPVIASKLKSRREKLVEYAEKYYRVLSRTVDIPASAQREFFEIHRINDDSTSVNIYKINANGKRNETPFYSRTFHKKETYEIRLYGISGEDEYLVTGFAQKGITVRLIGGPDKDKFTDRSAVSGPGHKTEIYDDKNNEFQKSKETVIHTSSDSSIHEYKYGTYKFDKQGFTPLLFYSNDDRIYLGLKYTFTKNRWRREPYGFKQSVDVKYSISQKAFSATYKGIFTKLVGKWDGVLYANYDFVRWTNFFGLGNESKFIDTIQDFNRMRTRTWLTSIGGRRIFGKYQKVSLNAFVQGVDIIHDTARFIEKTGFNNNTNDFFDQKKFVGANLEYVFQRLNDSTLPTKGIGWQLEASYTYNLSDPDKSFARFGSEVHLYIPILKNVSAMIAGGASTLSGTPEFYQYNKIGSSQTMRGHRRDRFWGNSAVYNQNELRWVNDVRSYLYNGKIGVFALYDIGRVWLKNEKSNTLHSAYGGGIILSPYNLITAIASYAVSKEGSNIHLALVKIF